MILKHDAIRKVHPEVITIRGEEAFDINDNPVVLDETKVAKELGYELILKDQMNPDIPNVTLVLGAGNVSCIPLLDIIYHIVIHFHLYQY